MTFASREALWLLLGLVPIVLLQLRGALKGRKDMEVLGRPWEPGTSGTLLVVKWFFGALTFDLFVALAVFALADPGWGERPVEEDRENLDVVVALDISRSMLATDLEPSRLERSLALVRAVSRRLPVSRFALVAFKGDAVMLLPLTEDLNALEAVLDGTTPDLVSTPGTDLERGLDAALDTFPPGTNAHRAVVLISDGESLSGASDRATARARELGTPVVTIVAGTPEGSTLYAANGEAILDEEGRPVVSRARSAALQDMAAGTGGVSVSLEELDAVTVVVDTLREHVERRDASGFRLVTVRRYSLFIGLALIMLALSLAIRVIRWREMF